MSPGWLRYCGASGVELFPELQRHSPSSLDYGPHPLPGMCGPRRPPVPPPEAATSFSTRRRLAVRRPQFAPGGYEDTRRAPMLDRVERAVALTGPPLVVTSDPLLTEQLQRLCAATATTPDVVTEAGNARGGWRQAACVLVGDDLAGRGGGTRSAAAG